MRVLAVLVDLPVVVTIRTHGSLLALDSFRRELQSCLRGYHDLLRVAGGGVRIGGKDVTHLPPSRRPTTTMFQDYALFPHMNLRDNVGFGLRMAGTGRRERHRQAEEKGRSQRLARRSNMNRGESSKKHSPGFYPC